MSTQMLPVLSICIDEYLDGEQYDETELPSPVDFRSTNRKELALAKYKLWESGQILRIRFLDGEKELHQRVETHARKWLEHANLGFEFGNFPDAEIRITFKGYRYSSLIGIDALNRPNPIPTMILGGFTKETNDLEIQRVVLHEFGHALGCVHEQSNPTINIAWDKNKVYDYYMHYCGWSKPEIDNNVLKRYSPSEVHFSLHDPQSIMQYPVPKELTTDGSEIGWNTTLSENDILFIKAMYP